MTRFRTLLRPDPQSTPKDDQDRASKGLAEAVAASRLRWWRRCEAASGQGRVLLVAVAPFSQYDLALLDLINERLDSERPPAVEVYVVNLLDYDKPEQLEEDFPGIGQTHQTPLATLWGGGAQRRSAWGKQARDLTAEALGLPAAELLQRIVAQSPSNGNSVALPQPVPPPSPLKLEKGGSMTDEQRRFLWQCYRDEQKAGGPARDRLPYTRHFDTICARFNAHFQTKLDQHEIWSALSALDKNPDRRQQIGCVD